MFNGRIIHFSMDTELNSVHVKDPGDVPVSVLNSQRTKQRRNDVQQPQ